MQCDHTFHLNNLYMQYDENRDNWKTLNTGMPLEIWIIGGISFSIFENLINMYYLSY